MLALLFEGGSVFKEVRGKEERCVRVPDVVLVDVSAPPLDAAQRLEIEGGAAILGTEDPLRVANVDRNRFRSDWGAVLRVPKQEAHSRKVSG